jgi:membrane protein
VRTAAETARSSSTPTAGAAGLAGLLTLVYGGSRAFTAAGRALDAIAHESSVNRSLLRRLQDIGWTLVVLLLVLALGVLAFAGGQALEQVLHLFGVQELSVWRFLRWPAAILAALLIVTVVRWAAPTGSRPRFSLLGPGVALTVGVLLVETVGFDIYVSEFSSYNTTYGAFAGGVILLLWIWLAAIAFLLGAELDAVMHTPPAEAGTRACPPPTLRRESRQGKRPTRST